MRKDPKCLEISQYPNYIEEIAKCEEYFGAYTHDIPEANGHFGINLWIQSLQHQAHINKFIIPIEYYFAKNTIPALILLIAVLLIFILNVFKETTFVFSLIVGVYIGVIYAFVKLRNQKETYFMFI